VHLAEWMVYDQWAAVFAIAVTLLALVFVLRYLARLPRYLAATD